MEGKTVYERPASLKRAAELIRKRSADLARITMLECGKPIRQSEGEWGIAADLFECFAEEGKRAYGRWVPSRKAIPFRRWTVKKVARTRVPKLAGIYTRRDPDGRK